MPPDEPKRVSEVLETCLYVDDLEAAEQFYGDLLGLKRVVKVDGRHVFFRCGDAMLLLFNPEATAVDDGGGIPPHGAVGSNHVAFRMDLDEIDDWRDYLNERGVRIELEYTWPNGGYSLYFRDPHGNSLELVTPKTWGLD